MKRLVKGFTLIELMIVVAIIGILAAIAIPAYQDYIIRAQISEGLSLASPAKTAINEYYHEKGTAPSDRALAGLTENAEDTSSNYVSSVNINNGAIVITYGNKSNKTISGKTLTLTPYVSADHSISWRCQNASQPPNSEEMEGASYEAGTILNRYLPSNCRS